MHIFWKCVPVVAIIATISVGPGAADLSAQSHQRMVVEFEGPADLIMPSDAPDPEGHVAGFPPFSCASGSVFNIESGKAVGSVVECSMPVAGEEPGVTSFVQFFDLPGGRLVTKGLGAAALVPGIAGNGAQVMTTVIPQPGDNMVLEATGRFGNVQWGQVRLSGFLDVTNAGSLQFDVNCIFIIDLYRGRRP